MRNRHELHAFNYINRPYAEVRRQLLASPDEVFRRATRAAANPELHAKAGPFDIAAAIDVEILGIDERDEAGERPATTLTVAWRATNKPHVFPTMSAKISLYPLTPTETQLELDGVYDPPLGVLGDVVDAVALPDVARASVQRFVDDTAAYLRF